MTLPTGWSQSTLGRECRIEIGGTPSRGMASYWDADSSTKNAWVSIKDMRARVITSTAEHISDLGVRHSNVKLQTEGSVLLSFKLTIGRVAFAGIPLYTNEAIAGLQSEAIDLEFLYHGLQQWDLLQGVDQAIKGATLNKSKLKQIGFVRPKSRAEQSKIAEVLSTVDRSIAQTEALIAKQQRIKTGLMQDLLTRGIDEHGQLRSEATHSFKDSRVGRIPAEWGCEKLSIFVPTADYGISSSLGADGYPVLRMNNLLDGEAELSDLKHTDTFVPEHLWLRNEDVLFNRTNSWEHVGRTGIWRNQIEKATFASYLVRLNPDLRKLLPELLSIWLNWAPTQIAMRTQATPAVQQVNINPTNLRSIFAAFPIDLHEQQMIVDRLAGLKTALVDCSANLEKLRRLRIALMQDLLTGKVRVTPLLQASEAANA